MLVNEVDLARFYREINRAGILLAASDFGVPWIALPTDVGLFGRVGNVFAAIPYFNRGSTDIRAGCPHKVNSRFGWVFNSDGLVWEVDKLLVAGAPGAQRQGKGAENLNSRFHGLAAAIETHFPSKCSITN